MNERHDAVIATPLPGGLRLGIRVTQDAITHIDFLPADHPCNAPGRARKKPSRC